MRKAVLAALLTVGVLAPLAKPAGAVLPAAGVLGKKNMEWVINWEQTAGSDIEFLERKMADGSLKRYAIVGAMGNGFSIIDITDPALPVLAGEYVSPGLIWQADIQVNPRRNIVVLSTDQLGASAAHNGGIGIELVDITNLTAPTRLSVVSNVDGAHNATIINDDYIYTVSPVYIVKYTNAQQPVNLGKPPSTVCAGHDITVDPNRPNIAYNACGSNTWQILDVTDPAAPQVIVGKRDTQIATAHQADPSPDSSVVVVTDERGGGLTHTQCPGGGLHVYDISGKYAEGASMANPVKLGIWFAPFSGPSSISGGASTSTQWGNCTSHNMTFQSERWVFSIAWYSAGSFIGDLSEKTLATGGQYAEWSGGSGGLGPTTWGNTFGNFLPEGAETWSTKFTRFDDPKYDRYVFTSDISRGFDTFRYTGPLPKKVAWLQIDPTTTGGAVTGKLVRFAVWTYNGWENKPLAGQSINVSGGSGSATVSTGADGSFSAPVGVGSVTATWAGNDEYQQASVTRQVT